MFLWILYTHCIVSCDNHVVHLAVVVCPELTQFGKPPNKEVIISIDFLQSFPNMGKCSGAGLEGGVYPYVLWTFLDVGHWQWSS